MRCTPALVCVMAAVLVMCMTSTSAVRSLRSPRLNIPVRPMEDLDQQCPSVKMNECLHSSFDKEESAEPCCDAMGCAPGLCGPEETAADTPASANDALGLTGCDLPRAKVCTVAVSFSMMGMLKPNVCCHWFGCEASECNDSSSLLGSGKAVMTAGPSLFSACLDQAGGDTGASAFCCTSEGYPSVMCEKPGPVPVSITYSSLFGQKKITDMTADERKKLPVLAAAAKKVHDVAFADPTGIYWPIVQKRKAPICYMNTKGEAVYEPPSDPKPTHYSCNARMFLSSRDGGKRYHSGLDLYGEVGDSVVATEDGTVVRVQWFYLGTCAVIFQTDSGIVINYGELGPGVLSTLKEGQRLKAGDEIGVIGNLKGLDVSMVHFETYAKGTTGPWRSVPKAINDKLRNPTNYLLHLREHGILKPVAAKKCDDGVGSCMDTRFETCSVELVSQQCMSGNSFVKCCRGTVTEKGASNKNNSNINNNINNNIKPDPSEDGDIPTDAPGTYIKIKSCSLAPEGDVPQPYFTCTADGDDRSTNPGTKASGKYVWDAPKGYGIFYRNKPNQCVTCTLNNRVASLSSLTNPFGVDATGLGKFEVCDSDSSEFKSLTVSGSVSGECDVMYISNTKELKGTNSNSENNGGNNGGNTNDEIDDTSGNEDENDVPPGTCTYRGPFYSSAKPNYNKEGPGLCLPQQDQQQCQNSRGFFGDVSHPKAKTTGCSSTEQCCAKVECTVPGSTETHRCMDEDFCGSVSGQAVGSESGALGCGPYRENIKCCKLSPEKIKQLEENHPCAGASRITLTRLEAAFDSKCRVDGVLNARAQLCSGECRQVMKDAKILLDGCAATHAELFDDYKPGLFWSIAKVEEYCAASDDAITLQLLSRVEKISVRDTACGDMPVAELKQAGVSNLVPASCLSVPEVMGEDPAKDKTAVAYCRLPQCESWMHNAVEILVKCDSLDVDANVGTSSTSSGLDANVGTSSTSSGLDANVGTSSTSTGVLSPLALPRFLQTRSSWTQEWIEKYQSICSKVDVDDVVSTPAPAPAPAPTPTGSNNGGGDGTCTYKTEKTLQIKGNADKMYTVTKILKKHLLHKWFYDMDPLSTDGNTAYENTMTIPTACAFERMYNAAQRDGVTLQVFNGFRTLVRQEYHWEKNNHDANKAARPGTSNHGTGTALDLNTNYDANNKERKPQTCPYQDENSSSQRKARGDPDTTALPPKQACLDSQPYMWLAEHAAEYGFVRTVPTEPWHWGYLGPSAQRSYFTVPEVLESNGLTWTKLGVGVSRAQNPAMTGKKGAVFIGYAGFKPYAGAYTTQVGEQVVRSWVGALNQAALRDKYNVGTVYAVRGPADKTYTGKEISNSKIVNDLMTKYNDGRDIIIAAHSSGAFVANELLSQVNEKAKSMLKQITYFNLDGAGAPVHALKAMWAVYGNTTDGQLSSNAGTMKGLSYAKPLPVTCPAGQCSSVSNMPWVLHMLLISKKAPSNFLNDMKAGPSAVQTDYLEKLL